MTARRTLARFVAVALAAATALPVLSAPGVAGPLPRPAIETAVSGAPLVEVGDRRDRRAAAAIFGLAAGAIIGGALAAPRNRVYVDPGYDGYVYYERRVPHGVPQVYSAPRRIYRDDDVVYYAPRVVEPQVYVAPSRAGRYEPWTAGWFSSCEARYRSFDPRTGTFLGYDGRRHFCN